MFLLDEIIFAKGEIGNIFYIIKQGEASVTQFEDPSTTTTTKNTAANTSITIHPSPFSVISGGKIKMLTSGMHFGEKALIEDLPRSATVTAMTDMILLTIDRENFLRILGPLNNLIQQNLLMKSLKDVKFFSSLIENDLKMLFYHLKLEHFQSKEIIYQAGDTGDKLYIVKSGIVELISYKDYQKKENPESVLVKEVL